ncbi:hypothetical protein EDS67_21255 [candidate division KSB1 bacterium]|nr:MAG: hypothetical protein EDS67_21255 [candidate division KSB1 bacterium]MBC6947203.1 hypothetical protein [candidate division KSB1 bacterium]MCE7943623.1 hypothetical protein [Chlorobi bacterium CHB1]MDL1876248.1 hypothetical protein [Cytophagia bacterium CHB2]
MDASNKLNLKNLILVPALITLAITLLRLTGELMNWAPVLFNKQAGGGGALVGISWLIPIFGFYFARKLLKANDHPAGMGRLFGFSLLALAVSAALFAVSIKFLASSRLPFLAGMIVAAGAGLIVARKAWPSLFTVLFTYGLAARIPVALIMLIAILNNWGTHYDVPPPNFPDTAPLTKWVAIGLVPQLTVWMAFTVIVGLLFGGIAAAVTKRNLALAQATS